MQDFKIIKKIGEGSFGKVYKVKRNSDSKIYAIKTINISKLDYEGKQNTLNEIRILCSFSHEYIIGYKEAFVEKNGKIHLKATMTPASTALARDVTGIITTLNPFRTPVLSTN